MQLASVRPQDSWHTQWMPWRKVYLGLCLFGRREREHLKSILQSTHPHTQSYFEGNTFMSIEMICSTYCSRNVTQSKGVVAYSMETTIQCNWINPTNCKLSWKINFNGQSESDLPRTESQEVEFTLAIGIWYLPVNTIGRNGGWKFAMDGCPKAEANAACDCYTNVFFPSFLAPGFSSSSPAPSLLAK